MMTQLIGPRLYVGAVLTAGAGLLVSFAPRELQSPALVAALLTATVVLSTFKLRLPLGNAVSTMTLAYAVDFLALIVVGAGVAMLLGAAGVLVQCTVRVRRRQPLHRTAFSVAAVVIAVHAAAWMWNALGGNTAAPLLATLLPLIACALTYYLVNTGLVVGAIAVTSSISPARAWSPVFWWSAPAYFLSAFVAGLVALSVVNGLAVLTPLLAVPLWACYLEYQKRWAAMSPTLRPAAAPATV